MGKRSAFAIFVLVCLDFSAVKANAAESLLLRFRDRESAAGTNATISEQAAGAWALKERQASWTPQKTAIVICDMWDKHWCDNATKRVAEMAPRMNEVVRLARERGVFIIHCPSDTMEFYKDFPQRKLAQAAPVAEAPVPLQRWCRIDPSREPPLPIDDSNGGCDDEPAPASMRAWKKQHDAIEINERDAITDSSEAYYLLKQRGIENVIVMGVHTNMCVLGRPFSIRQLVYQGLNVALMRDMTDTMYDPDASPHVTHAQGTELVIEHIEKYWCPTILSSDLTGKPEFSFSDDKRPHVVFVVGEDEYQTEQSLPHFAAQQLQARGVRCTFVHSAAENPNHFPQIADVDSADLLVLSVRRRLLPKTELDIIRKYVASGKPLVAIRTSSHAFASRNLQDEPPADSDLWPTFDTEVLGAKYEGHYGKAEANATSFIWKDSTVSHPLATDLVVGEKGSSSWLYKYTNLAPDVKVLQWGHPAGSQEKQPVSWIRTAGSRVFYTMQGHPDDFQQAAFRDLLRRAILWGLEK